jgi:hypothetical protein
MFVHTYMCVCMYVCVCVCTFMWRYVCMHVCICMYICSVCMCVVLYIYVRVCTRMYVCVRTYVVYVCVCTFVWIYVCMHACMYVCVCTYIMYVCMNVCTKLSERPHLWLGKWTLHHQKALSYTAFLVNTFSTKSTCKYKCFHDLVPCDCHISETKSKPEKNSWPYSLKKVLQNTSPHSAGEDLVRVIYLPDMKR